LFLAGRVLREPCCVYEVYVVPLWIPEFSLRICTERIVKKLVLGAVYRLTTQAQDFSRESEQFLYLVYVYLSCKCNRANRAYNSRILGFSYIYVCYHLSILWLIFVNVFVGSLPQFFNAWVDYLLYSYDLSLKAFSVGLLNLFRLKSSRNKRSENIRTDVGISLQGSFIKLRSFINPNSYHLLDQYLVNWGGKF